MTQLKNLVLSLALATATASSWAAAPELITEAPAGVVEGVSADASPEMQAEPDDLVAQWEADARAVGIDPRTAEAGTEQN